VLIGVLLAADGLGQHLPRGYVYAAMAFSIFVELLQLRQGAKKKVAHEEQAAA
jgi:predicted tellurium resistance membrane protein TerC